MSVVNLNARVSVKLNELGAQVINHQSKQLNDFTGRDTFRTDRKAGDTYRTQLWCLMKTFGPHIRMGSNPPFEAEIEVDNE